jgi:hypothetical protein
VRDIDEDKEIETEDDVRREEEAEMSEEEKKSMHMCKLEKREAGLVKNGVRLTGEKGLFVCADVSKDSVICYFKGKFIQLEQYQKADHKDDYKNIRAVADRSDASRLFLVDPSCYAGKANTATDNKFNEGVTLANGKLPVNNSMIDWKDGKLCIISTKAIKNGQQVFVDYNEGNVDIDLTQRKLNNEYDKENAWKPPKRVLLSQTKVHETRSASKRRKIM